MTRPNKIKFQQAGFSLIEAIVAIFVITIGLIGTAGALSYAIHFGSISRNVTAAKGMVISTIEEIETLRNSRRLDFKQIGNEGEIDNVGSPAYFSGFSHGFQDVSINPGPDGVYHTSDDLTDAGPDGTFGTGDDFPNPAFARGGYRRQIIITNLNANLKKVEVRIRYFGSGGRVGEIAGVAYLNNDLRTTR